jgi:hypothetical protein
MTVTRPLVVLPATTTVERTTYWDVGLGEVDSGRYP